MGICRNKEALNAKEKRQDYLRRWPVAYRKPAPLPVAEPVVPTPPVATKARRPRLKYTDAQLVAAWLATPEPKTIDRMATVLGEHRRSMRGQIERHHLSIHRLRAIAENMSMKELEE